MTPQKGAPGQDAYTFVIHISYQCLSSQYQFSLSGADLGIYLYGRSRGKRL
jgi:hypothetical protein